MGRSWNKFFAYAALAFLLLLTGCAGGKKEEQNTGRVTGENQTGIQLENQTSDSAAFNETGNQTADSAAFNETEDNVDEEQMRLQTLTKEYISLVETALDHISFRQMGKEEVQPLEDLLLGHYDVIGRSAGDGVEYYVAVRKEDAPEYEDYGELSVGYFSGEGTKEVLRIGYYNSQFEETILYELDGYMVADFPLGTMDLSSFCLRPNMDMSSAFGQTLACAFTPDGRATLEFLKKWPGLSFYQQGDSGIQFYYQDEDTITFYSEPYPCYIKLEEEKVQRLKTLLSNSAVEEKITSAEEAKTYLDRLGKDDNGGRGLVIQHTGAGFFLDGQNYVLLGNCENGGYVWCSSDMGEFRSLVRNQEVYDFVMDEIYKVMGLDYGDFDPGWFQSPLKSASMVFPEFVTKEDGSWETEIRSQMVTDEEKLSQLQSMMDAGFQDENRYGLSGCPYLAYIDFTRQDGESLRVFVATDSCDSMAYKGRIGLQYGSQQELAEVFDEAEVIRPVY